MTWTRLRSKDHRGVGCDRRFKTAEDAQRAADKFQKKTPDCITNVVWLPLPLKPWRVVYYTPGVYDYQRAKKYGRVWVTEFDGVVVAITMIDPECDATDLAYTLIDGHDPEDRCWHTYQAWLLKVNPETFGKPKPVCHGGGFEVVSISTLLHHMGPCYPGCK